MIQICFAEKGEIQQVNASLRDIERTGSLELFLHKETGIDEEAILAYLSDGTRLRSDNVRELVGAHDQTIFVFNKDYLDTEWDEALRKLKVEPTLSPPIEETISSTPPFRPADLAASYRRAARAHHDYIHRVLPTLNRQHQAVQIAFGTLDLNILSMTDAFEGIASAVRKDLEKQASLLAGLDADMQIMSRVKIHVVFMSPTVRTAIENGDRHRTLGDYVSGAKMRQVSEVCSRTHDELRVQFSEAERSVRRLIEGTEGVRATLSNLRVLEDAQASVRRSEEYFAKVSDLVSVLEDPRSSADNSLQELKVVDQALREEVAVIVDTKNDFTAQCMGALRQISLLNNDLVQLPTVMTNLQAMLRGKTSFPHILRLHNMLYAYGATVIEIVRRKEFSQFFYQRAQSILEVMAKLSASERRRRQVYRSEIYGQLPFDTKGMDDPVPTIDFSPTGSKDAPYPLERHDVEGLLQTLEELETYARSSGNSAIIATVQESRMALEKLVHKMDSLESDFDRIAERSLLSASRLSWSRRRFIEADDQAFQELSQRLHDAEEAKAQQEKILQDERASFQSELERIKSGYQDVDVTIDSERERADQFEKELQHVRARIENEVASRRLLEKRQAELMADNENQRQELARALSDATEQTRIAETLRQELAQVRAEAEEVKQLEERNGAQLTNLVEEQATILRNLEEARARGEDLESQIAAARKENDAVNRMLQEADREKERLLRLQASEHDRKLRDHIAEADGDRAVLEHQFLELKAQLEAVEQQLKDTQAQVQMSNQDAVSLREELSRVERELRNAYRVEQELRDEWKKGQVSLFDLEHRLENNGRLLAQILDVAIAFRNSHVKALSAAQAMTSHTGGSSKSQNMAESAFSSSLRHSHHVIGPMDEPPPIDPSEPSAALEALRSFDHDHFLDAITKTGSTIRKWQKQCKEYRERAKGKISFRNFARGDLALFLPTRNSVSKPWAAFNVSFPHYFLQATGHLAEQLKSREWIVARITSIAERVVDHKDPASNPYGLGDGVKYYMLEVEDWTQQGQANRHKTSSRKASAALNSSGESKMTVAVPDAPVLPPGPPQAEVESSFSVTQPPTSSLFPVRTRANSSPTAGPSSLSRLLAQAPAESGVEIMMPPTSSGSSSPATSPPPPPPPTQIAVGSVPHSHAPSLPSPLRPGSRASRGSSSSKFSVSRLPPIAGSSGSLAAAVKAAPTTALSEHSALSPVTSSSTSPDDSQTIQVPPSLQDSFTEGMSSMFSRRRTTSYYTPRVSGNPGRTTSTTAASSLANLATSLTASFARKKKPEMTAPPPESLLTVGAAEMSRDHSNETSTQ